MSTTEFTAEELTDTAERMLRHRSASGVEATERLAAEVAKDPIYAFGWADADLVTIHFARHADTVLRIAERDDYTLLDALRAYVDEVTTDLVGNSIVRSSTSGLSNAVAATKAEASARFVREFGWYVKDAA